MELDDLSTEEICERLRDIRDNTDPSYISNITEEVARRLEDFDFRMDDLIDEIDELIYETEELKEEIEALRNKYE